MPGAAFVERLTFDEVSQVLRCWAGGQGGQVGVLAFVPEGENVAILQSACNAAGTHLGGAVFPAVIAEAGLRRQGVVLLNVGAAPPSLLIEGAASSETAGRVTEVIAEFVESWGSAAEDASLFCIFDGLDPMISSHLDRLYLRLADMVRYVGVNAGSDRFVSIPCLFDNSRQIAGGVLVQLLPGHPGAWLEHGFRAPEQFSTATSASGNRVVQIDWRPALDVYREMIHDQYGVAIDRDNFYRLAVNFPFGILRADGEVQVRIPVALDEGGAIVCVGEIPPASVLALLDARGKEQDAVVRLAARLGEMAGTGARIDDLLVFYCAGRRLQMGQAAEAELRRLAELTNPSGSFGALTLGEIGTSRAGGYPLFHNATIVGMPWSIH